MIDQEIPVTTTTAPSVAAIIPTDQDNHVYAYETTSGDDWARFIAEIHAGDNAIEMDNEMYFYWLEGLPPIYMGRSGAGRDSLAPLGASGLFGFAEGRENIVDFWEQGKRYFCRGSQRMNMRA